MIRAKNLSKIFLIPHEQHSSLKNYFVDLFTKTEYEKFDALNDVTFEVGDGEWLGIIGRNGSGKSTLLKMLAGIYLPDSGDIEISGNVAPFLELGVGFEPELSARENIHLNGLLLGMTRKQIKEQFNEIIHFAEVQKFVDQKLKNFSSGMKVRLAFAIAMHAPADTFLIDEIFAVGDYAFQQKSLAAFKNKFRDKTVLFVSHDLAQLADHCSKVMWLENSKIQKIGPSKMIIEEYKKYMLQ